MSAIYYVDGLHDLPFLDKGIILWRSALNDQSHSRTSIKVSEVIGFVAIDVPAKSPMLDIMLSNGTTVRFKFEVENPGTFWDLYLRFTEALEQVMSPS
jgi:hypothetical protein